MNFLVAVASLVGSVSGLVAVSPSNTNCESTWVPSPVLNWTVNLSVSVHFAYRVSAPVTWDEKSYACVNAASLYQPPKAYLISAVPSLEGSLGLETVEP